MNAELIRTESPPFDAVIPFSLLPDAWMLGIRTSSQGLRHIDFLSPRAEVAAQTAMAEDVVRQIEAYFENPGSGFDLPLDVQGSPFQQRVWQQLVMISASRPLTYGELADNIGSGARAVGNACRRNPVPLVVPCHRVVAKSGLGGFAGSTQGGLMSIKQALLAHESHA